MILFFDCKHNYCLQNFKNNVGTKIEYIAYFNCKFLLKSLHALDLISKKVILENYSHECNA